MIGDSINTENIITGDISDESKTLIGNGILEGEGNLIGNTSSEYAGKDGFSPLATVTKEGIKTIVTITDRRGTTSAEVLDGAVGPKGPKGDKPIRGTDYWTKQDQDKIVKEAAALAIPIAEADIGNKLELTLDSTTYEMTLKLLNKANVVLSTQSINLPVESLVVDVKYINDTKEIVFTLSNGTELRIPIGDMVNGLVSETTFNSTVTEINKRIKVVEDNLANANKNIGRNTKRIKTLETNIFDSGLAEGTSINIQDSALAEMQEVKMSIDKAQETTEGYNLFDVSDIKGNIYGVDFENEKDGTIIANGTFNNDYSWIKQISIELFEDKQTYTFINEKYDKKIFLAISGTDKTPAKQNIFLTTTFRKNYTYL